MKNKLTPAQVLLLQRLETAPAAQADDSYCTDRNDNGIIKGCFNSATLKALAKKGLITVIKFGGAFGDQVRLRNTPAPTIKVTATITKSSPAFSGVRVIQTINGKKETIKLFSSQKFADQYIKNYPGRNLTTEGKDVWEGNFRF